MKCDNGDGVHFELCDDQQTGKYQLSFAPWHVCPHFVKITLNGIPIPGMLISFLVFFLNFIYEQSLIY